MYQSHEELEHLIASVCRKYSTLRTGSRVICSPPVMTTDIDLLVYTEDFTLGNTLLDFGFKLPPGTIPDEEYGALSSFKSYKKDNGNILITHKQYFFSAFREATAVCAFFNVKDKKVRIAVFQCILYGNTEPMEQLGLPYGLNISQLLGVIKHG